MDKPAIQDQLQQLSDQMAKMLRHISEVRRSNLSLESRLDAMEMRMDRMESRLDAMETRMDRIESRLDAMETRMDRIESRLDTMESRIDRIDSRFEQLETQVLKNQAAIATLSERLDQVENHLVWKIDHVVSFVGGEQAKLRFHLDSSLEEHRNTVDTRFDKVEKRLTQLEAV